MRTEDLIKAISADVARMPAPMDRVWWIAVAVAAVVAFAVFEATLGPRPDIALAVETVRFLYKFVVTLALAVTAFAVVRAAARPGARASQLASWLLLAPVLALIGALAELAILAPAEWMPRLAGSNSLVCLTYIPIIGIGPLAVFLAALRHGAPTRPGLAGVAAGILAGGIAATFYAAQCIDDSPLFVATWYTIAISSLAALGGLLGRVILRW